MDASNDILRFPDRKSRPSHSSRDDDDDDDGVDDFESWEVHSELRESEDYPALVRYCEREVARHLGDPYANERLGNAYVLNGQYQKAIDSMGACHRKHPDIEDFQHIILDALFALGKTESDFP
jgi:hypothetical protein